MVKEYLTLRQLNFDKPLKEYYETHETQEMLDCIDLYDCKKLCDYEPEDVRKMIMQKLFLEEMMLKALDILYDDEMYKAQHFSGDLLSAVVRVGKSYWKDHKGEQELVQSMLEKLRERVDMFSQIFESM